MLLTCFLDAPFAFRTPQVNIAYLQDTPWHLKMPPWHPQVTSQTPSKSPSWHPLVTWNTHHDAPWMLQSAFWDNKLQLTALIHQKLRPRQSFSWKFKQILDIHYQQWHDWVLLSKWSHPELIKTPFQFYKMTSLGPPFLMTDANFNLYFLN